VAQLAPRGAVLGADPCGGSEVMQREDKQILQQAGIPVSVYAEKAASGTSVTQLPLRSNLPLLTSLEYCLPYLRREPQSLLLSYNEPSVAGLAPDRSIIRFDWTTPLPRYWKFPFWLPRFQRSLYLFPSESERKIFLDAHPRIPEDRVVVIPNAVDTELFYPRERQGHVPRVGFAGQWTTGKGVDVLLKAWEIVRRTLPEAELWLAGGPGLWKATTEKMKTLETARIVAQVESARGMNVKVCGEMPRSLMPGFWNSLTLAVVPSLCEAFGLVALEALSCGTPVVASRVGGLPEIVSDGECGLLVPPGNPDELAQALLTLLINEPLSRRFALAARNRAMRFSTKRRAHDLLRLLEGRVIGGGGNRPSGSSGSQREMAHPMPAGKGK
jgi:glycosyltransferase involved in cell wall biosynthesis